MIRELVLSHYPEGVTGIKDILNVNEINTTVLTILYTAFKTIGKNSDEFRCLSLKCLKRKLQHCDVLPFEINIIFFLNYDV